MDAAAAEHLRTGLRLVRGRSPLYERLLAGLAGAAERGFDGGVIGRLLAARGPAGIDEALLLVLAALHHAALGDPHLPHAAWFATVVGDARVRGAAEGAPAALALAHLVEHEEAVADFVSSHRLQTNDVGRCAALLPGFLIAASTGLPLRLLELGTSAGLHLRFERYRVRYAGGPSWGPSGGPTLDSRAEGAVPRSLTPPSVEVAERRGVDLNPLDVSVEEDVRLLRSFVWPDERDRHVRLQEAIAVARTTPARLDRGDLVTWARDNAAAVAGTVTVLFHSQVRHLLERETTAALAEVVDGALRTATADAPLVYVAFEAPLAPPERLSGWPELTVAVADGSGPARWSTPVVADWHGRWVRWT